MSKTHTLNLNRGAIRMLRNALMTLGWYKDTADAYRAGQVLELPEMELPTEPKIDEKDPQRAELIALAWLKEPVAITLSEKQRDAVKHCVAFFVEKGGLQVGPFSMPIIHQFGLAPED